MSFFTSQILPKALAKRLQQFKQHIATLLAQYLQAPAKPSQHFDATFLGATRCVHLATLLRRVATCWELKIELVRIP